MLRTLSLLILSCAVLPSADMRGWIDLMPRDAKLTGWTRLPAGKTVEVGPDLQWTIDSKRKVLICSGDKGHEYLQYTARTFKDFVLHAEWRFIPQPGEPRYNSGILFRNSADGKTWHQAQTGPAGGFLFGETLVNGQRQRVMLRDKMSENRVKPAGEWNEYEITARGRKVTLAVNGSVVNEWDGLEVLDGYIALEAEGFPIEFRNLKVKELN